MIGNLIVGGLLALSTLGTPMVDKLTSTSQQSVETVDVNDQQSDTHSELTFFDENSNQWYMLVTDIKEDNGKFVTTKETHRLDKNPDNIAKGEAIEKKKVESTTKFEFNKGQDGERTRDTQNNKY
jgi:hypothetical protein